MLARPVDPGKWLFVEKTCQAVSWSRFAQYFHGQHLVIGRQVAVFENRGNFILPGCDFVVAGLHRHAKHVQLGFAIGHISQYTLRNGSEVLVFHFLPLGRSGAKKRSARVEQVRPGKIKVLVNQKIFLLWPNGRENLLGCGVAKQLQNSQRVVGKNFHRLEQWGFLVQRFAGPTEENRGNDERGAIGVFDDECGACGIPCRVTTSFESGADTTRWE